jgi:hypothetical protein
VSLDVIQSSAFIHNLSLFKNLFISFNLFVNSIAGWRVRELQLAECIDELFEGWSIMMQAAQVSEESDVGEVVGQGQIDDIRDYCVGD